MDLEQHIEAYLARQRALSRFSETTVRIRKAELLRFERFIWKLKLKDVSRIHKNHIAAYLGSLRVSAATKRHLHSVLASFFDYLVEEGAVMENVVKLLPPPPAPRHESDYLTPEEIERYFQAVVETSTESTVDRNLLISALLVGLCLRVSEVASLRLKDLDLSSRPGAIYVRRKGGVESRLPLNDEMRNMLDCWLEQRKQRKNADSPWLFPSSKTPRISARQIQTMVRKALQRAKIIKRRMGPHLLRHSGASQYLADGTDIKTIQLLLGHANLATTSRYVHSDERALEAAVRRFRPRRLG